MRNSADDAGHGRGSRNRHPIDVYVGARIRERRLLLGMSQQALARRLGISYQLVQKYEQGASRIMASRIKAVAAILGVPIDYLFPTHGTHRAEPSGEEKLLRDRLQQTETLELIRLYYGIADRQLRARFLELVKAIPPDA